MAFMREMTCLRAAFGALLFGGLLAGAALPANAQGREDRCREYARDSVKQAEDADRGRCGFQGPRWSNDRGGHFAWCMLFPRQADDENRQRRDDLRKCVADRPGGGGGGGGGGNREGKRANCDTYSKIAKVQAEANDKFNCGNRGGEWSSNARGHFQWCMTNKREFMLDEVRFRQTELQKCFNNLGDFDDDNWDRNYRRRF